MLHFITVAYQHCKGFFLIFRFSLLWASFTQLQFPDVPAFFVVRISGKLSLRTEHDILFPSLLFLLRAFVLLDLWDLYFFVFSVEVVFYCLVCLRLFLDMSVEGPHGSNYFSTFFIQALGFSSQLVDVWFSSCLSGS